MIRFSLTRLQQQAPYELILSGDTEIMLYMCDTSDGREEIRNRLFLSCFEKHADKKRFTICKAHANIEGQGIFFVIVIENSNPKLHAITAEFRKKADLLTQDKPSD